MPPPPHSHRSSFLAPSPCLTSSAATNLNNLQRLVPELLFVLQSGRLGDEAGISGLTVALGVLLRVRGGSKAPGVERKLWGGEGEE